MYTSDEWLMRYGGTNHQPHYRVVHRPTAVEFRIAADEVRAAFDRAVSSGRVYSRRTTYDQWLWQIVQDALTGLLHRYRDQLSRGPVALTANDLQIAPPH